MWGASSLQAMLAYWAVIWLMTHAWELAHSYMTGWWKGDPSMQIRSRLQASLQETAWVMLSPNPLGSRPPLACLHFLLMAHTCLPRQWYLVFLSQAVLFASGKVSSKPSLPKRPLTRHAIPWSLSAKLITLIGTNMKRHFLGNYNARLYTVQF